MEMSAGQWSRAYMVRIGWELRRVPVVPSIAVKRRIELERVMTISMSESAMDMTSAWLHAVDIAKSEQGSLLENCEHPYLETKSK